VHRAALYNGRGPVCEPETLQFNVQATESIQNIWLQKFVLRDYQKPSAFIGSAMHHQLPYGTVDILSICRSLDLE
jgi:hypothetical protein